MCVRWTTTHTSSSPPCARRPAPSCGTGNGVVGRLIVVNSRCDSPRSASGSPPVIDVPLPEHGSAGGAADCNVSSLPDGDETGTMAARPSCDLRRATIGFSTSCIIRGRLVPLKPLQGWRKVRGGRARQRRPLSSTRDLCGMLSRMGFGALFPENQNRNY